MRARRALIPLVIAVLLLDVAALASPRRKHGVHVRTAAGPAGPQASLELPPNIAGSDTPSTTVPGLSTTTTTATSAVRSTPTAIAPRPIVVDRNGLYVTTTSGTLLRLADAEHQPPSWSPDGTRIAFRCQGGHLCVVQVGSGTLRRVDAAGTEVGDPTWSPDGTTIAWGDHSQGGIRAINADGSGAVLTLTPTGFGPVWSRQGTLAYFAPQSDGHLWLSIVQPGSAPFVVAKDAVGLGLPAWSPDGSHLAYMTGGLTTIGVDGKGEKHVTGSCCAADSNLSLITWAPDSSIYFGDQGNVVAIHADGSGYRAVAEKAAQPMVSLDGSHVGFCNQARSWPDGASGNDIELAGPQGEERHVIVPMPKEMLISGPIWSPDGRNLAFVASRLR